MTDQVPFMNSMPNCSRGVQIQRKEVPVTDKVPKMASKGLYAHGSGVQAQRRDLGDGTGKLSSPFPFFGGKSRWIDTVWKRIGKVGVWSEPCMGTAVMTLNNPEPAPREVICDLNAYICNFYRSLRADPDAVAYHADWPTNHHDLTARHRWLLAQGPELRERMTADPDDFDAKIAGWWVWGQSSWIGHGWCDDHGQYDRVPRMASKGLYPHGEGVQIQRKRLPVEDKRPKVPDGGGSGVSAQRDRVPGDQIPHIHDHDGGKGVQQQRDRVPWDQIPFVKHNGSGQGVQQQRDQIPRCTTKPGGQGVSQQRAAVPHDKRPRIYPRGGGTGGVNMQRDRVPGVGVSAQRVEYPVPREGMPHVHNTIGSRGVAIQRNGGAGNGTPAMPELVDPANGILDGSRLRPWFRAIAERLARVIILNRGWEWALTDSVLQQTPSSPKPAVGVFLDPPYRTQRKDGGKRSTGLYQGDNAAASDAVAAATYAWALEHGDKYRVAYCMHQGDFPIPPGWTAETMGFSGHRDAAKREKAVDQVIFSPACVPVPTDPQLGFDW